MTQAELLAQHRNGLDAAFAAKYPNGKITVRTKVLSIWHRDARNRLVPTTNDAGKELVKVRVCVSLERYRSTSHIGYPAATVCFVLPQAPNGNPEQWDALEAMCPPDWESYTFGAHNTNNDTGAAVALRGFAEGLADKTSTYASAAKCLTALNKRGAGPNALSLVQATLDRTPDQVSAFTHSEHCL